LDLVLSLYARRADRGAAFRVVGLRFPTRGRACLLFHVSSFSDSSIYVALPANREIFYSTVLRNSPKLSGTYLSCPAGPPHFSLEVRYPNCNLSVKFSAMFALRGNELRAFVHST
jgi:hypothetical protein